MVSVFCVFPRLLLKDLALLDVGSRAMIKYNNHGIHHFKNLFKTEGSLFGFAAAIALPPSIIAAVLKGVGWVDGDTILENNSVWSGFTFLVGFLVVFRTSQAYSRFWDGATATHRMRAQWHDACSAIMAFCCHSSVDKDVVLRFQHRLVRLFSILHATALGEIEEIVEGGGEKQMMSLQLIDPEGLDAEGWMNLRSCSNKCALVFSWIQVLIVQNIKTGVLSIPPPILSRVFQELAEGMVVLHDAEKIAEIPFPFPYVQTCDLLLGIHLVLTPLVSAQWAVNEFWAFAFAFVQVFAFWALNGIATEIEHPFGRGVNDLEPEAMQKKMNELLLMLLHPAALRVPELTEGACVNKLGNLGRNASVMRCQGHDDNFKNVIENARHWRGSYMEPDMSADLDDEDDERMISLARLGTCDSIDSDSLDDVTASEIKLPDVPVILGTKRASNMSFVGRTSTSKRNSSLRRSSRKVAAPDPCPAESGVQPKFTKDLLVTVYESAKPLDLCESTGEEGLQIDGGERVAYPVNHSSNGTSFPSSARAPPCFCSPYGDKAFSPSACVVLEPASELASTTAVTPEHIGVRLCEADPAHPGRGTSPRGLQRDDGPTVPSDAVADSVHDSMK